MSSRCRPPRPAPRRTPTPAPRAGIADQLRRLVETSGATEYDLSKRAEVAQSVLSRFMRRERSISLETADRLCAALGAKLVETGRRATGARSGNVRRVVAREEIEAGQLVTLDGRAIPRHTPGRDRALRDLEQELISAANPRENRENGPENGG